MAVFHKEMLWFYIWFESSYTNKLLGATLKKKIPYKFVTLKQHLMSVSVGGSSRQNSAGSTHNAAAKVADWFGILCEDFLREGSASKLPLSVVYFLL